MAVHVEKYSGQPEEEPTTCPDRQSHYWVVKIQTMQTGVPDGTIEDREIYCQRCNKVVA
jgi:hypothetical protein